MLWIIKGVEESIDFTMFRVVQHCEIYFGVEGCFLLTLLYHLFSSWRELTEIMTSREYLTVRIY